MFSQHCENIIKTGSRQTPPPSPENSTPVYSPKECSPRKNRKKFRFVAVLFWFLARYTRIRIEDYSGNRPVRVNGIFRKARLRWGGMFRGGKNRGRSFRGIISDTDFGLTFSFFGRFYGDYNLFITFHPEKEKVKSFKTARK